jgi:tryptophanyl-tRNA synthetase
MSLQEPHLKMSKSHLDPRSRILLTDNPDEITRKVMSALTDSVNSVSYDPVSRPGVSNLLQLLSYFSHNPKSAEELGEIYAGLGLGDFKALVSQTIADSLEGIRARYTEVMAEDGGRYLDYVEAKGAERARASAEATMAIVRDAVGF